MNGRQPWQLLLFYITKQQEGAGLLDNILYLLLQQVHAYEDRIQKEVWLCTFFILLQSYHDLILCAWTKRSQAPKVEQPEHF